MGTLRVRVLTEGVHSGMATGIAPTPFRICEQLLARLEKPDTGDMLIDELQVDVPRGPACADRGRRESAGRRGRAPRFRSRGRAAAVERSGGASAHQHDWRATLAVTGADGLPPVQNAGNVLLPEVALKLSLRLPPTCDAARRGESGARQLLERDPPYGAQVTFEAGAAAARAGTRRPSRRGWKSRLPAPHAQVFGKEPVYIGSGGTIPFMGMLGEQFPQTQFFITGVLGPQSNAHGPNEFLHIDYAQKLTACVALVLADHAKRQGCDSGTQELSGRGRCDRIGLAHGQSACLIHLARRDGLPQAASRLRRTRSTVLDSPCARPAGIPTRSESIISVHSAGPWETCRCA